MAEISFVGNLEYHEGLGLPPEIVRRSEYFMLAHSLVEDTENPTVLADWIVNFGEGFMEHVWLFMDGGDAEEAACIYVFQTRREWVVHVPPRPLLYALGYGEGGNAASWFAEGGYTFAFSYLRVILENESEWAALP